MDSGERSDTYVFQYRYIKNGNKHRSSMSIDPFLLEIFAKRMGGTDLAIAQLRRWAANIAANEAAGPRAGVSRLVHRRIYELLDDA